MTMNTLYAQIADATNVLQAVISQLENTGATRHSASINIKAVNHKTLVLHIHISHINRKYLNYLGMSLCILSSYCFGIYLAYHEFRHGIISF